MVTASPLTFLLVMMIVSHTFSVVLLTNELNNLNIKEKLFGIIYLNTPSIRKHIDNLYNLLGTLDYKFPTNDLSEHKIYISMLSNNINLPGYSFCYDKT